MSATASPRIVHDDTFTARTNASSGAALRPASFDDYVGQTEVIANLRDSVRAARRGGWTLDHCLFAGAPGLGKTSLAAVIAAEMGAKLHATSAPAFDHKGVLASLLTTLEDGDFLFIDEIHALDRSIVECLYPAMEDRVLDLPNGRRLIRVPLPRFTLLGATTHAGRVPRPLLDRFGFIWQLHPYALPELKAIVARSAAMLEISVDDDGCFAIARASRGTPRIANRLLRRVRDAFENTAADRDVAGGTVSGAFVLTALERLGIDPLGLDPLDRRYLALLSERPLGIEAISSTLSEQRATIEEIVEPYLVQLGFISRTPRGRILTPNGLSHLRGEIAVLGRSCRARSYLHR